MKFLLCGSAIGLALLSSVARAAELEEVQTLIGKAGLYILVAVAIIAAVYVYFMRSRDRRAAPVSRIFESGDTIHSVGPNALVTDCVRAMTTEKVGALMIMEGDRLLGIFTERDALNKVLAAGLDPRTTKISEVMTRDPVCIPPTTTVRDAMRVVTQRRFRHLPIMENGKVLALVSSGDLTHWLVKDQIGEVQELVDLAARS